MKSMKLRTTVAASPACFVLSRLGSQNYYCEACNVYVRQDVQVSFPLENPAQYKLQSAFPACNKIATHTLPCVLAGAIFARTAEPTLKLTPSASMVILPVSAHDVA
jgi:hypothetical protein